jgi:protein ImuB
VGGSTLVRTLVVWCPDWPVVAAGLPPGTPVAVVHANRVVACSPSARDEGVRRGQRRREAQGRCPALEVVERDPALEARAFEPVVAAVEDLAPGVELTRPGACAVPTRGPSRFHGGDDALAVVVRDRVAAVLAERGGASPEPGVPEPRVSGCRIGVADGPFAATLAARSRAGVRVVPPGATTAFLAPLPLRVLDRPALTEVLARLGLRTLGDLAALPATDVLGRFGPEGAWAHRVAAGIDDRLPGARHPPPDLRADAELDPPALAVDRVAFAARALGEALHERLAAQGLACTRVVVEAETEHGEVLARSWRHEGGLSAGALADRARWQLDAWLQGPPSVRPSAGVIRLSLLPDEVVPARGRQLGFWGGETAADERAVRALVRVEALLGPEAVRVPEWRGGRDPHEQVVLVPRQAVGELADRRVAPPPDAAPWPGALPAPSPASQPPEPVPAAVVDAAGAPVAVDGRGALSAPPARVAVGGGPWQAVTGWAGPWPVEERWWDPRRHRRRARLQVVSDDGTALLLVLEAGAWHLVATYD